MLQILKKNKIIIKGIVASLLLWYVFKNIDCSVLMSILANANPYLLVLAFLLAILSQLFISNYKWLIILKEYKIIIPFKDLCNMYLVGMFFNIFLPGAYGGDFVRAHQVSKYTEKKIESIMSVILERLTGLLALLLILYIALIISKYKIVSPGFKYWGIGLITFGFLLFFLLFVRGFVRRFSFLFSYLGERFNEKSKVIYESIYSLKNKKIAFGVSILSLLFQLMTIIVHYLIALSINVNIPFSYLMLTIPIILIFSMLPITLNGIGVRDLSYISFFGVIGIDKEASFSIGFIAFFMGVSFSLIGGLIYFNEK